MKDRDNMRNTDASGISVSGGTAGKRPGYVRNILLRTALAVSAFVFWLLIGLFWTMTDANISYLLCCVFLGALSSAVVEEEGSYPHILSWCFSKLDNPTDSIMLL